MNVCWIATIRKELALLRYTAKLTAGPTYNIGFYPQGDFP
jgi:hypothetical protein